MNEVKIDLNNTDTNDLSVPTSGTGTNVTF